MTGVFADKTALITGASSGVGRSTARAFAAEGAKLILLDIDEAGLTEVCAEIGSAATAVCADLRKPEAAAGVARDAIAEAGGVNYLANVAGVTRAPADDRIANAETDKWLEILAINLISPAMLLRAASEDMISRHTAGRIVNISSSSAFRAASPPSYAAAKAGILGLTRTAAAELGPHNINVNAVVPGPTLTAMLLTRGNTRERVDGLVKSGPMANLLGRPSEPEDVASLILYLCRPESRQITGQAIHTSAGAVV